MALLGIGQWAGTKGTPEAAGSSVTLQRERGLSAATQAALRGLPRGVEVGILVRDVSTGAVLEAQQPDRPLIPASTMKMVTGAAVLAQRRGTEGWWSTDLTVPAQYSGKSASPTLTLRGTADPTLRVQEGRNSLRELAQQAYAHGLRSVGRVQLADGEWQGDSFLKTVNGEPMPAVRLQEWENRPPRTTAQARARLGAALIAELRAAGIQVKSEEIGTAPAYRPYQPPPRQNEKGEPLPPDPVIPLAQRPEQGVASVQSGSVLPFVLATLRPSDNSRAEALLATLAVGSGGNLSGALEHARQVLAELGVDMNGVKLADGSGLSRESRLTPRALTDLAKVMYDLPYPVGEPAPPLTLYKAHRNAFIEALPLAGTGENLPNHGGRGGTMSLRLVGTGLDVRAKTGTLPGVSNLSGYVTAKSGRVLVFAILMNGPETTPLLELRALQDRVVEALAAQY